MIEYLIMTAITVFPFIELRGAIIYGVAAGIPLQTASFLSIFTNVMLIIPLYLFLRFFYERIENWRIVNHFVKRIQRRTQKTVEKYGALGLTLFVAIPLPMTGAYTGMIASFVLGLEKKKAMLATALGVLIAGILITILTLTGVNVLGLHV